MNRIVENFDQFIQQASITQVGDPKIFGKNPKAKKKKNKSKHKSNKCRL